MTDLALKPTEKLTPGQNTYILQQKEFFLTWGEWAAKNRQQVLHFGSGTYTVPKGFDLYITSASLSATNGSGSFNLRLNVGNAASTRTILTLSVAGAVAGQSNQSSSVAQSYPMPILVRENDEVAYKSGGVSSLTFSFQGWLEPKG